MSDVCISAECEGMRLDDSDECFAHSGDEAQEKFLTKVRSLRQVSGLANTSLSQRDIHRIVDAGRGEDGRLSLELLDLSATKINGMLQLVNGSIDSLVLATCLVSSDVQLQSLVVKDLWAVAARIVGDFQMGTVQIRGDAWMTDMTVDGSLTGRENGVVGEANLVACRIRGAVRLHLSAAALNLGSARIEGGGDIRYEGKLCNLRFADLSGLPILISSLGSFKGPRARVESRLPAIVSIESANVSGLTLAQMDLRYCKMTGAHNLDKLRIEENCMMSHAPRGWLGGKRYRLPLVYSHRRVVYEEIYYRAAIQRRVRWLELLAAIENSPDQTEQESIVESVHPGAIAAIYRSLRKGREDAKDEPGAADFYYGEMEMRRQRRADGGRTRESVESGIIWLYWLVSGYSLRAWRSVVAALFVILVSASTVVVFWPQILPGKTTGVKLFDALWMVLAAMFLRTMPPNPPPGLSRLLLVVSVVGPLLVGLGLLAVRGRVKR